MIRKLLLACTTVSLLILTLYSLGSPSLRADLSYVNPSGIHSLDPVRMSWTQDFRVALNLWDGLTSWDPETLQPIASAAELPPRLSADRRIYTFTVRADARWSNGEPLTAFDFVRGWRRAIEPGSAADYSFLFSNHVVGAAAYVAWRNDAVARLSALRRLRDGWRVDAQQSSALAEVPSVARFLAGDKNAPGDLQHLDIDWKETLQSELFAHAAELEERFARVGIRALDARTLEVRLVQPCPYFLDLLGLPVFLPVHASIERLRERQEGLPITAEGLVVYDPQWTKPDYHRHDYPGLITNGPYRLANWTFKRRIRMEVNPYHRLAQYTSCRTVDMLVYENVSAALMAYEAGDVDFLPAMNVPYDHKIAQLALSGERQDFYVCPTMATYFLNFNCVRETVGGVENPFRDAQVRKAFALAIDKAGIVDRVLGRGDRVAHSFVPADVIRGYVPPDGLIRDTGEARRLLSRAGFPDGNGMPVVELLYTATDERITQAVARMWEATLGVHVRLQSRESKTFAEDKANQRFMIARGNWYADYSDPTTFLDCLTTGNGNNDSGYANPAYDALIDRANAVSDAAARAALLREAEAIIVEQDFPILPVFHYATPIAIKPYVKGLHPNARLWFPFHQVRIER